MENPETRKFKVENLHAHLHEHRRKLVAAALTVLRAYRVAGKRPKVEVEDWGGFIEWSHEIREPLVWLGAADPCKTRAGISDSDPDREAAAEVLQEWALVFANVQVPLSAVIAEAAPDTDLRRVLLMVAADYDNTGEISPRRLGHWCRNMEGRIVNGLQLKRGTIAHHAVKWQVNRVGS